MPKITTKLKPSNASKRNAYYHLAVGRLRCVRQGGVVGFFRQHGSVLDDSNSLVLVLMGALCTVSPVAFQAALRHVPRGYYPRALGAALRQQLIYLPLLHVKTTTSASRYDIRSRIECTIWSKIIAEDYQQGLLDRLNEQVKGARCSHTSFI